jgi:pimeloyl-ACP methyl ester carboxylesterase
VRRGLKILIGLIVVAAVLLAVNTIVIDNQTREAEVTVDGGRILSLPGGELQVTDTGEPAGGAAQGPPIVLLHCFACSLRWWDSMVPLLARDHRVIRIDLLGHGGSAKPQAGYAIPEQGSLVAAALGRLDVQGAVVVGHSLGGAVAVAVAEQASELVDRIVLIDEAPDSSFADTGFLASLARVPVLGEALWRVRIDSLVKKGYEDRFAPGYEIADGFSDDDQVVRDNDAMTYTAFDDIPGESDDYTDEIPLDERIQRIAVPLMVIFGSEDQVYDPSAALSAYRDVPGARLETIDGAGHSPNVEKPRETARLIDAFAASGGSAPGG